MFRAERLLGAGALFVFVAAADAQVTTKELEITVLAEECPGAISVVMRDDVSAVPAERISETPCLWKASLPRTISTAISRFSLRVGLGKSRTECHVAEPVLGERKASLVFFWWNMAPVFEVTISASTTMHVSYMREVSADVPRVLAAKETVPCTETGSFPRGSGVIKHVEFGSEDLRLQFGLAAPDTRSATGLLIDDLPQGRYTMTRDDVVYRFTIQQARGDKSRPRLSPDAIDIDHASLAKAGLNAVEIEVKK